VAQYVLERQQSRISSVATTQCNARKPNMANLKCQFHRHAPAVIRRDNSKVKTMATLLMGSSEKLSEFVTKWPA
jgi:hypothetical protein